MLSRDQLLAKVKCLPRVAVHVDEWGTDVNVRGMTGGEYDAWRKKLRGNDAMMDAAAWVVSRCVVDGQGVRVFNDGDAKALAEGNVRAIEQLFAEIQKLSHLDREALDKARKNSDPTPSAG